MKKLDYDLTKKVDRLGRPNRTRSPTPPRSPQRRNRTRCYACNEDGHFANNCLHKKITEVKSESKKEVFKRLGTGSDGQQLVRFDDTGQQN